MYDSFCYFQTKTVLFCHIKLQCTVLEREMPQNLWPKSENSNNLEGRKGDVPY